MPPQTAAQVIEIDELRRRQHAHLVEERGLLQEKIDSEFNAVRLRLGPQMERAAEIDAHIQALGESSDAEKSFTIESANFVLSASPKEFQRKIFDKGKCFRALKLTTKQFIEKVTITMKLIDERVPDEKKQAAFLTKARTGARDITILRKATIQKPAA